MGRVERAIQKRARKKKSKFTPEELEVQNALVVQLHAEIEKVKEAQLQGYANKSAVEEGIKVNLGALAALDSIDIYQSDGEIFVSSSVVRISLFIIGFSVIWTFMAETNSLTHPLPFKRSLKI